MFEVIIKLDLKNIVQGWQRITIKSHMEMACQYAVAPLIDTSYFPTGPPKTAFLVFGGITDNEDLLTSKMTLTLDKVMPVATTLQFKDRFYFNQSFHMPVGSRLQGIEGPTRVIVGRNGLHAVSEQGEVTSIKRGAYKDLI